MIKFTLWFGLKLCERILKISDNFSMTLQKQLVSAAQGYEIAQQTLQCMRNSESFKNFFEILKVLHSQFNVEASVLPRKRRAQKYINTGEGEFYLHPGHPL